MLTLLDKYLKMFIIFSGVNNMIPLIALKNGETGTVLNFGGDEPEFERLRSFGLDINTEIAVVTTQADKKGPILLSVNGSKYALDYDLASKVLVRIC